MNTPVLVVGWGLACGGEAAEVGNRLGESASPYLQRHAADPVHWGPWDDASLQRARTENKLIFLSIGYLACHWCAVMHRESFLDPEVASVLNERFVAIKVDREERPDVDSAWIAVVAAATGRAGWPLTLVLAPDLTPMFAGSFLPPRDGERGFERGLLTILSEASLGDRAAAAARGAEITASLRASRGIGAETDSGPARLCEGQLEAILARTDLANGGFGRGSHFPQAAALERLADHLDDPAAREALIHTLDAMAAGGLRDHLRGGFFRYTVDSTWKTPHFEKMLVDQATLARLYAVAAERVPERAQAWRAVAAETLDFSLRELSLGGGFGTGLDAESEGREGAFYLWSGDELVGLDGSGWRLEGGLLLGPVGLPVPDAWRRASDSRPRPELDRKQVASWNGLMISALAVNGFAQAREDWLVAARRAADAGWATRAPEGVLPRTATGAPGMLEDQANFGLGLLDLHAATGEGRWLERARALRDAVQPTFGAPGGGWFRAGPGGFQPWGPERPVDDGPEPSGTAAMAEFSLRIAVLDGLDPRDAWLALESVSDDLRHAAFGQSSLCGSHELATRPPPEVVLALPAGADAAPLLRAAASGVGRGWTLVRAPDPLVPIAADKVPIDGKATAYLCTGGVCALPTTDPAGLQRLLSSRRR